MQEGEKNSEVFQKNVSTEHTFIIWVKEEDSEGQGALTGNPRASGLPQFFLPPTCSWSRSS